jgi:hypothetical protein
MVYSAMSLETRPGSTPLSAAERLSPVESEAQFGQLIAKSLREFNNCAQDPFTLRAIRLLSVSTETHNPPPTSLQTSLSDLRRSGHQLESTCILLTQRHTPPHPLTELDQAIGKYKDTQGRTPSSDTISQLLTAWEFFTTHPTPSAYSPCSWESYRNTHHKLLEDITALSANPQLTPEQFHQLRKNLRILKDVWNLANPSPTARSLTEIDRNLGLIHDGIIRGESRPVIDHNTRCQLTKFLLH